MRRFENHKPTLKDQRDFIIELMNQYWTEANNSIDEEANDKVCLCMSVISIYDRLLKKDIIILGENDHDFEVVDTYLDYLKGNGMPLQAHTKKCPGCGEMFSPKNQAQEVCSGKCRVRMHRNKNRLKDFNQKVEEILRAKNPEAKFTVEQLMVEKGKCPFVVTYQGTTYKADNTKSLLTKIKKGS